jgi:hypothetical protein
LLLVVRVGARALDFLGQIVGPRRACGEFGVGFGVDVLKDAKAFGVRESYIAKIEPEASGSEGWGQLLPGADELSDPRACDAAFEGDANCAGCVLDRDS